MTDAERPVTDLPRQIPRESLGHAEATNRALRGKVEWFQKVVTQRDQAIAQRPFARCRVIEREYINSADFKNWAIPQARHEWVLVVDADERVTAELAAEIRQVLSAPRAEIDGYWIDRRNHFLGHPIRYCGRSPDSVCS